MILSLESWFLSLPVITQVIVSIICALTIFMIGPLYNNRTLAYGPTVLTMMGIFGCFLGISLGLMNFQTDDIQGSVPELLNGIKTAFWASVTGVGGALIIKTRHLLIGPPRHSEDLASEATIDDLALLLRSLHQSLAGKEDSTLLSQTKLLRQESRDGLNSLRASLDSYMEKIADSNSKALIEALKEVIRDFNAKINEQFGDNFKQLNAAVERILIWQEKYREQLTEMIEQQNSTASSMAVATSRYTEIVTHAEAFAAAANNLTSLINTLNVQREQIASSIAALGDLLKSANDSLPKIEERVIEMTRQIESGVRANNEQIVSAVSSMTQSVQTAHTEMKRLLIEAAETANKDVHAHIKQLSEMTRNQVVDLDNALSEELTKSIETLGEHLTALSRRFVDDYTPLTERLRTLVQTARQVQ